jgi:hypothetical protein
MKTKTKRIEKELPRDNEKIQEYAIQDSGLWGQPSAYRSTLLDVQE